MRSLGLLQQVEDPQQIACMTTGGLTSQTGPCTEQRIHLPGPIATQVATFQFAIFRTHGLSPQMAKGYRSCLPLLLCRSGKAAVVHDRIISDMIYSMESEKPRLTSLLPEGDLGFMLEALSKPSYELLQEATLKHLT